MEPKKDAGRPGHPVDQRVDLLLSQLTLREKAALLSGQDEWHIAAIESVGIPALVLSDGPYGARVVGAGRRVGPTTACPMGVSMASSWNRGLIERVGAVLAEEARATGCDMLPGLCGNIGPQLQALNK